MEGLLKERGHELGESRRSDGEEWGDKHDQNVINAFVFKELLKPLYFIITA